MTKKQRAKYSFIIVISEHYCVPARLLGVHLFGSFAVPEKR
jgi:hypothetical protein